MIYADSPSEIIS